MHNKNHMKDIFLHWFVKSRFKPNALEIFLHESKNVAFHDCKPNVLEVILHILKTHQTRKGEVYAWNCAVINDTYVCHQKQCVLATYCNI